MSDKGAEENQKRGISSGQKKGGRDTSLKQIGYRRVCESERERN